MVSAAMARPRSAIAFTVNEVAAASGMKVSEVNSLIDYSTRMEKLRSSVAEHELLWRKLTVTESPAGRNRLLAGPASIYAAVIENSLRNVFEPTIRRLIGYCVYESFLSASKVAWNRNYGADHGHMRMVSHVAPGTVKKSYGNVVVFETDEHFNHFKYLENCRPHGDVDPWSYIACTAWTGKAPIMDAWRLARDLYEETVKVWSAEPVELEHAASRVDVARLLADVPEKVMSIFEGEDLVEWDGDVGMNVVRGTRIPVADISATLEEENGNAAAVVGHYPDLTEQQVRVADMYHRAHPPRGRPRGIKDAFPEAREHITGASCDS